MTECDHTCDPSCEYCRSGLDPKAIADEITAQTETLIDRFGYAIITVQGSCYDDTFAYTVGLAQRGWPEIILASLQHTSAQMILNEAIKKLAADQVAPAEGMIIHEAVNVPLRLGFVAHHHLREHLRIANERAERMNYAPSRQDVRGSIPGLQLIWPDTNGRFPDEAEYDHTGMPQKLLDI